MRGFAHRLVMPDANASAILGRGLAWSLPVHGRRHSGVKADEYCPVSGGSVLDGDAGQRARGRLVDRDAGAHRYVDGPPSALVAVGVPADFVAPTQAELAAVDALKRRFKP